MNKLIKRGNALAQQQLEQTRSQVKSALDETLPESVTVEKNGDGVIIKGSNLSHELLVGPDLRDVAFLMRGVR